jgi:hypothetical protein
MVAMKLKTATGAMVDVDPAEVLRAAGVIYQARRRVHAGPPRKAFRCCWCRVEVFGRVALDDHERSCDQQPDDLVAFTGDLAPWPE